MMRKIKRKGIKEYPLLQKTIRFLISAIVLLAPCFFSGPQYWKWAHGGVAIITLLLLVSIYYFLRKRIDYVQNPIFYLISFFILVVTLQLLPLPQLTPKIITSHWYNLQHLGLNIAPSLSLFPQKTSRYLYILLSAFGLFFLVLNFFKTKKELIALTILITLSCFSHAIYAFVVDMGSNTSHLIHGGYANKNHFAMLMEMGIFTSIALFCLFIFSSTRKHKMKNTEGILLLQKYYNVFAILAGSTFVIMFMALVFSFSRAGLICTFLSLLIFTTIVLKTYVRDRKSLYLFIIIIITFFFLGFRGIYAVYLKLDPILEFRDGSGFTRYGIWLSSIKLLKNYWLTGVGLGAYCYTSTIYESGMTPGKIAYNAHNDYLELLCEFGIPLGLFFIFSFFAILTLFLIRRHKVKDKELLWISLGAFLAILSVLGHEFFEYGLRKTSNLYLFMTLLALFFNAASPKIKVIKIKIKKWRYLLIFLSLLLFFYSTYIYLPYSLANTSLSKLYALKKSKSTTLLSIKDKLDYKIKLANKGLKYLPNDRFTLIQKAKAQINLSVYLSSKNKTYKQRNELLENARKNIKKICSLCPTDALKMILYAKTLERINIYNFNKYSKEKIAKLYEIAHKNAPNISYITELYANYKFKQHLNKKIFLTQKKKEIELKKIKSLFRKVIIQNPGKAKNIYNQIWFSYPQANLLLDITPNYPIANQQLYNFFYKKQLLDNCLSLLKKIRNLKGKNETLNPHNPNHLYEYIRMEKMSLVWEEDDLIEKEAIIYGRLKKWEKYKAKNQLLRKHRINKIKKKYAVVLEFYEAYQYLRAELILEEILSTTWFYHDAVLLLAKVKYGLGKYSEMQALIFSLSVSQENISTKTLRNTISFLNEIQEGTFRNENYKKQFPVYSFIEASLKLKIAENFKNTKKLNPLKNKFETMISLIENNEKIDWFQKHLLYYNLGKIYKLKHNYTKALKCFLQTRIICPQHLWAAQEIKEILDIHDINVNTLTPSSENKQLYKKNIKKTIYWLKNLKVDRKVNLNFGGTLQLYGYCVNPEKISKSESLNMKFYWLCLDNITREYRFSCKYQNQDYGFYDSYMLVDNQLKKSTFSNNSSLNDKPKELISMKIGEIICVSRIITPLRKSLSQSSESIKEGKYNFLLYPYSRGIKTKIIQSIIKCELPAFKIISKKK